MMKRRAVLLYENFGPLTEARGETRIYSPISYAKVRYAQFVPIVHAESLTLAGWFPICWKATGSRLELIVLRSIWSDGSHQPNGSPETPASLPLALRAYPFVVQAPDADSADSVENNGTLSFIEDVIPDRPTDIGATILRADGKPGRGAEMRLRAVAGFRQAWPLTKQMTDELAKEELLEPWPLKFEIEGKILSVPDMLIVRQSEFQSPKIFRFIQRFGSLGASLLGAHRISLFRAGNLLRAAGGNGTMSLRST